MKSARVITIRTIPNVGLHGIRRSIAGRIIAGRIIAGRIIAGRIAGAIPPAAKSPGHRDRTRGVMIVDPDRIDIRNSVPRIPADRTVHRRATGTFVMNIQSTDLTVLIMIKPTPGTGGISVHGLAGRGSVGQGLADQGSAGRGSDDQVLTDRGSADQGPAGQASADQDSAARDLADASAEDPATVLAELKLTIGASEVVRTFQVPVLRFDEKVPQGPAA